MYCTYVISRQEICANQLWEFVESSHRNENMFIHVSGLLVVTYHLRALSTGSGRVKRDVAGMTDTELRTYFIGLTSLTKRDPKAHQTNSELLYVDLVRYIDHVLSPAQPR